MGKTSLRLDDELEEASRVCGRSWFDSFRNITLPLSIDGMSNAFLWIFIDAMKELTGIILLITTGGNVFTNYIMGVYKNDPGALPDIAAGAVMFSMVIFGFIILQTRFHGRGTSRRQLY